MSNFYDDYNKLLILEKKYNLYELKVNDDYIWPYLRNKIYGLIHKKNIQGNNTKINKFNYKTVNKNEMFTYVEEQRDAIVFNFSRKELNDNGRVYDERTYKLKETLKNQNYSFYEVDFYQEGLYYNNVEGTYNCNDIILYYEKYKPESILKINQKMSNNISKIISDELQISFEINDYMYEITKKIQTFHKYFYEMFVKLKPKFIFVTANYMSSEIIIPAKKLGIPVYEVQYAAITDYHNGYHYNGADVPTYPDGLLTWGEYWSNYSNFPQNLKHIYEIGTLKKFNIVQKKDYKVAIISQNLLSKEIVEVAIKLAKSNPKYFFILRIHPNEEINTIYQEQIEKIPNIEYDINSVDFTLSTSEFVVGSSSTLLYEAIHYNCKLLLIDTYMTKFSDDLVLNKYAYRLSSLNLDEYKNLDYNDNKNIYSNNDLLIKNLKQYKFDKKENTKFLDEVKEFTNSNITDRRFIDTTGYAKYILEQEKMFTIIIPNYNGSHILKRTLDSICYPKYKNIYNVIFVDDCSTDNSLEIAKKYQQHIDMDIISTNYNSGDAGLPREIGKNRTKTRYLYFLDNDDIVNFQILIKAIYLMDIMDLDYVRMNNLVKFSDKLIRFENKSNSYIDLIFKSPFLWNGVYKKEVIDRKKIKMRSGIAEDFNFNIKYLDEQSDYIVLEEDIIIYFKELSTMSVNFQYSSLKKLLNNHIDSAKFLVENKQKKIIDRFYNQTIREYLIYNSSFELIIDNYSLEEKKDILYMLSELLRILNINDKINDVYFLKVNKEYCKLRISNLEIENYILKFSVEKVRNVKLKSDFVVFNGNNKVKNNNIKLQKRILPYLISAKYQGKKLKFNYNRIQYFEYIQDEFISTLIIYNCGKFILISYKAEKLKSIYKLKKYIHTKLLTKIKKIIN